MGEQTQEMPEIPANEQAVEPETKKHKTKKTQRVLSVRAQTPAETVLVDTGDAKDFGRYSIPESEDDPHWDPKLKNPVPEALVDGLAEFGWKRAYAAEGVRQADGKVLITRGKTRWRAIAKANKLRKAAGQEPLRAWVEVTDEDPADDAKIIENMRLNVSLNRAVQEQDPMTLAESMVRMLSAGVDERTVARDHAVSVNDLHGYLLLTDEFKVPPVVQDLIREGKVPFAAAIELARRAESMSKSEVQSEAERIAKLANGGVRVTTATVKNKVSDPDNKVATKKEIKQDLLDTQSDPHTGKHGEQVTMAYIIGLEVGIGTRSLKSASIALAKLAKGEAIKIDFKQYVPDGKKPVKGQEKK